jgi:hypothetical protein
MTIQVGNGPWQPASLKRIQGTASWAIDFGGMFLFPERAPKLRLRVRDAADWEAVILQGFAGVRFSAPEPGLSACCLEQLETA